MQKMSMFSWVVSKILISSSFDTKSEYLNVQCEGPYCYTMHSYDAFEKLGCHLLRHWSAVLRVVAGLIPGGWEGRKKGIGMNIIGWWACCCDFDCDASSLVTSLSENSVLFCLIYVLQFDFLAQINLSSVFVECFRQAPYLLLHLNSYCLCKRLRLASHFCKTEDNCLDSDTISLHTFCAELD